VSTDIPFASTIGPNVQNANRVVEDYLRAGEATARVFRNALGGTSGNGGAQDVAQRMLRSATDLMGFWTQFMAQWSGSMPSMASPPVPGQHPQPAPLDREQPHIERARVAIELDSNQPVTVILDLPQQARGSRLCVDRLHPRRSDAPPLRDVEIDTASAPQLIVIRLRVAAGQPSDIYNGVILDEGSGLPAGTLSVEVNPAGAPSRVSAEP
jgi:hypothetical protein